MLFRSATVVVVTDTVVVVAGTVVLVVVVVVTGLSSFRFAGGMIAGLLGALVTAPRIDTIQHRDPVAGVTSNVARRLLRSTVVTSDLSMLIDVSIGAFTPPGRRVQSMR